MANRSSNPTPKSYRQHKLDLSTNKRLKRTPKKKGMPSSLPQRSETKSTPPQHRSGLASRFTIAVLLSSAGLVAMFAWISILFMFDPELVGWLNKFLPEWGAKIHFREEP